MTVRKNNGISFIKKATTVPSPFS